VLSIKWPLLCALTELLSKYFSTLKDNVLLNSCIMFIRICFIIESNNRLNYKKIDCIF
jgi:hypothetical protein